VTPSIAPSFTGNYGSTAITPPQFVRVSNGSNRASPNLAHCVFLSR
jgi:hypothetical protein